jgi:nucleoside-diphosphate-sugar epimerase
MNLPKLFVTGINGLIGTVIRDGLATSFDIYGLDRKGEFTDRIFKADLGAYGEVDSAFRKAPPFSNLIHLAGNPCPKAEWDEVLKNNIEGTYNVFEAGRKFNVKRVVFASSIHVSRICEGLDTHPIPHTQHKPDLVSSSDPIRPDSYYGVSKAFGEALASYYCSEWGIEFVCLRIGTVLSNDDPATTQKDMKTWLSHRDLVQLVKKSLTSSIKFGIYYGISSNRDSFGDISDAARELGYRPQDDASTRQTKK